MRNLLLLGLLFVGAFSFAQNTGTGTSIEVTEFISGEIEYRHVQGSLNEGQNCFTDVDITDRYTLSLSDNGMQRENFRLTLTVSSTSLIEYQFIASENYARTKEWGQFSDSNRTSLMSDNSDAPEDLLGCALWVETDTVNHVYTNTQYPEYSIMVTSNSSTRRVQVFHLETMIHQFIVSVSTHSRYQAALAGAEHVPTND